MDKVQLKELMAGLLSYGWMIALAILGGIVKILNTLNQAKEPQPLGRILMELVAAVSMSAFAGIVTLLLCRYWGLDEMLTGAMVAMSGYLGGKSIETIIAIWKAVMTGGKVS